MPPSVHSSYIDSPQSIFVKLRLDISQWHLTPMPRSGEFRAERRAWKDWWQGAYNSERVVSISATLDGTWETIDENNGVRLPVTGT